MRLDRLTRVWLAALTGACGALLFLAVSSGGPAFADALADLERGSQARQDGNYRRALLHISRAIESSELDDGNLAVAYNNRCTVFNTLLRLDRALADCTRTVQLRPKFAKAYINRGLSLRRLGRYVPAIADYSRAVTLEPKLVSAYSNRAYAKYRLAAFESASSDYEKAIELAPGVPVLHGGLGIVRFTQERFDEAARHFSDANRLERSSLYWPLWHHLAARRAGLDDTSVLMTAARKLDLRKWPGPVILLLVGDLEESQALTRAGADNDTANPLIRCEGLFFAGQLQLMDGDPERAIEHFKKILGIKAIDVCDHTVAIVELRRLGVNLLPPEKQIDIQSGGQ